VATPDAGDAELVSRCRGGDETAWAALVERFSRYVYAICVQGFRLSPQDAEDAFQDVFTKAFLQLGSLRDDGAVRPWLAQLTRRACIDRLRRARPEVPVDEIEAGAEDVLGTLDEAIAVRQALAQLGEPCAEMLDRFFARDESYRTIADDLALPAGTIASRISRCLEKLKKTMEDSGLPRRPESR
jgi:RNA polymerase sigma factor (sigma-70 family)